MHGVDIGRKLSLDEYDFLRQRGFGFIARYYDGTRGQSAKCINATEVSYALSRNFGIVPIFQIYNNTPGYFTFAQGLSDGQDARADALFVGQPLGSPICFAVDFDTVDPAAQCVDYFNGVFTGLDGAFLEGIYGKADVCRVARESWPAMGFFWQTYAWSAGQVYAPADVYQHANNVTLRDGLVVDLNISRSPVRWRLA